MFMDDALDKLSVAAFFAMRSGTRAHAFASANSSLVVSALVTCPDLSLHALIATRAAVFMSIVGDDQVGSIAGVCSIAGAPGVN